MLPSTGAGFERIAIERCVVDGEVLGVPREQPREDAVLLETSRILVNVAVHEPVHHRRVSVNVDEEVQFEILNQRTKEWPWERTDVPQTASSLRFIM